MLANPAPCTDAQYRNEEDLPVVMALVDNELSEPYSIFTYRYFLRTWPHLCFMAFDGEHCFATVVAKMDVHRDKALRGYIAMLVVEKSYRYLGIGSKLVRRVVEAMAAGGAEEVALEAEVTNEGALRLYQRLGFLRDKRLRRYYLNGNDAYRLKLQLRDPVPSAAAEPPAEPADVWAAQQLQQLSLGGRLQEAAEEGQSANGLPPELSKR